IVPTAVIQANEVCFPANSLGCSNNEIDPDIKAELELGLGVGSSPILGLGRLGAGHLPSKISAGIDARIGHVAEMSSFYSYSSFTGSYQEHSYKKHSGSDIGVYVKFEGFPAFELSGHYLINALRTVEESEANEVNLYRYKGHGFGFGLGADIWIFRLRGDFTYYLMEQMPENVREKADYNGLKASLIVSVPFEVKIDL
ncbi:MAG: hypothetical protein OXB84_05760, partial [Halobacteriovoraceae bacterium]|nr:hypothetical protein [Halobacteriovoraceae bacterium]